MTFLAFVIFTFNVSVIGYLIYSWSTRNKPEVPLEEQIQKSRDREAARQVRYNNRTVHWGALFSDPGMLMFWFIVLPPTLVVLYVIFIY